MGQDSDFQVRGQDFCSRNYIGILSKRAVMRQSFESSSSEVRAEDLSGHSESIQEVNAVACEGKRRAQVKADSGNWKDKGVCDGYFRKAATHSGLFGFLTISQSSGTECSS